MARHLGVQRLRPHNCQLLIPPGKLLFRRKPGQNTVMMLEVLPGRVALEPVAGMAATFASVWIVRLILGCFELAFAERVVVTDPWETMAAGHSALPDQFQVAAGNYG